MTVIQFLNFIADIRSLKGQVKLTSIDSVIVKLALQSVLDKPIENLSKGFKRRVGLAQAIIHDPQILILDEPTDGLDPNQKHQVRELIQHLSKDKKVPKVKRSKCPKCQKVRSKGPKHPKFKIS